MSGIETFIDGVKSLAGDGDIVYIIVAKPKNEAQTAIEVVGDEQQREGLLGFFMKWVLTRASETLGL